MANHKSALKRNRQNIKRNQRNTALRSAYRTELKKFLVLVEEKNMESLTKTLPAIHKAVDKACSKGLISKNAASRKKSRLSILVNKLSA